MHLWAGRPVWKGAAPGPGHPCGDHRAYCDCCLAPGVSRAHCVARRFRPAGSRRGRL